jgi:hypothetical protein
MTHVKISIYEIKSSVPVHTFFYVGKHVADANNDFF